MKLKSIVILFAVFIGVVSTVFASETTKIPVDPRFAKADLNHDGKLDQAEFEQYLALLSKMKLAKPKMAAPGTIEKQYGNKGSYMESALGYAFVPVKSVTKTVIEKKEGSCCGGNSGKIKNVVETNNRSVKCGSCE
ncbi:MAG: hypothetical protein LBQ50_10585 [Planctomycetaceae bacterium]|jgi:hypothetical protein|nr:hypothetical protein [Planctomycetaceae bacterium]